MSSDKGALLGGAFKGLKSGRGSVSTTGVGVVCGTGVGAVTGFGVVVAGVESDAATAAPAPAFVDVVLPPPPPPQPASMTENRMATAMAAIRDDKEEFFFNCVSALHLF